MKIPSNKQWTQDNSGDVLGILGDTTNMSMDKFGKAILSRKAVSFLGEYSNSDFGYPLAINYFDGQYVVLTDDDIFTFNLPSYTLGNLTWNPETFLGSDAVVYNELYTVVAGNTGTTIETWNGGTLSGDWVEEVTGLTANVPHPMDVFGVTLLVGDANTVKTYSTSFVAGTTLTLPTEFQVTTIRAVNNYIYIGTKNLNGGNAKIFVWNGDTTLFDYECEVGASWVYSLTPYASTVAAITSQGQLGLVNGTTFQELAAFPVYYEPHARWQDSSGLTLNGKVFNRGMCTIGNTIYLNVDGTVDSGNIADMRSGIWVYDPQVGLYHRSLHSTDRVISDTSLTRSGDELTTSASHLLKTGDAVSFDSVLGLTGVSSGTKYYVTVVDANTIKLSVSRKALQAGRYITLGGIPTSDDLVYAQNSDYGSFTSTSGCIIPLTYLEDPEPHLITEVLWGSRIEDVDGAGKFRLYTFADSYNIGSFTSQRIYSRDTLDQSWKEVYPFLDGLITDEEEIIVKYQTEFEPVSETMTGVWQSANALNSNSASDFNKFRDIEEGFEIIITDGYGRGRTAHVHEMNETSGTVSLVLDESIGTINETCEIQYTTFKKVGTYTREQKDKEKVRAGLEAVSSPWIVLKFELRGFGLAVNTMQLSDATHKKVN